MTTFFRLFAVFLCLAVVLFFGLKSGSEVPREIATEQIRVFFNSHDALRNQLAFGLFGIAALVALMTKRFLNRGQLVAISLIWLLIPALEFAQLWMPERCVDIEDVLNGWLGLGLALIFYVIVWWFWQIATRSRSKTNLAARRP
jgi:hypothetical protein